MDRSGGKSTSRTRRAVVQKLESLGHAGVQQLSKPPVTREADSPGCAVSPNEAADPAPPSRAAESSTGKRREALQVLQHEVVGCTLCDKLATSRTQTVFGVGDHQARLCFLGEAPGADEDRQGEPFVGRAGQLLTKIIEACTLTRQEVYILNVLKCRPPGNRTPTPGEAANCRRFLDRQLEIIRPEFICCLGAVAATTLLATNQPVGRLRGRFHEYEGMRVIVTYHPAYLLRNPPAKREVWKDMKLLMSEMGIDIPDETDR